MIQGRLIKKLASRSIQTDKRRNLFVIVTIALAAVFDGSVFFVQEREVTENWRRTVRGQYQAVVVNCDRDTIESLKDCPGSGTLGPFPELRFCPLW